MIVTGTPGVGKTVHCEQLAQEIGLKHLSVNQVAKDRDCYETYDEERKSWVVDEDKVCFIALVKNYQSFLKLFPLLLFSLFAGFCNVGLNRLEMMRGM